MWDDIRQVYAGAGRFARLMPLLFLLPALPELMQHVAEVHLGMYASRAAAKAMAGSGLRLGFGYVKVLGRYSQLTGSCAILPGTMCAAPSGGSSLRQDCG